MHGPLDVGSNQVFVLKFAFYNKNNDSHNQMCESLFLVEISGIEPLTS